MDQKITNITILIPYKRAGGVIFQQEVAFDVYKTDEHYSLRPCLSADELEVANLPRELNFTMVDGKPVSLRGKIDGNFHVIKDAVALLKNRMELT